VAGEVGTKTNLSPARASLLGLSLAICKIVAYGCQTPSAQRRSDQNIHTVYQEYYRILFCGISPQTNIVILNEYMSYDSALEMTGHQTLHSRKGEIDS
jgi:hypothetical protein